MCTRYALISPHALVRRHFAYHNEHVFPPRYNIAPSQPVAIVRLTPRGERELALVRWGLVPAWVKTLAGFTPLLNARAETACEKAAFRGAFRHRRCLVPADGYYAWRGDAGQRQAHFVRRRDRGLLALAGIWECWLGADGSEIETMAILTVPEEGALSWLAARRPAILAAETFAAWLDGRVTSAAEAAQHLAPTPGEALEAVAVGAYVNNPRHEGPHLHDPPDTGEG